MSDNLGKHWESVGKDQRIFVNGLIQLRCYEDGAGWKAELVGARTIAVEGVFHTEQEAKDAAVARFAAWLNEVASFVHG